MIARQQICLRLLHAATIYPLDHAITTVLQGLLWIFLAQGRPCLALKRTVARANRNRHPRSHPGQRQEVLLAEEGEACLVLNILRSPLFPVVRQRCANVSRPQVPVIRACDLPVSVSRRQARQRPQCPGVLRIAECILTGSRRCNSHRIKRRMVVRAPNSRQGRQGRQGRHRSSRLPAHAAHNPHLRDHHLCPEGRLQVHLALNVRATSDGQISTARSSNHRPIPASAVTQAQQYVGEVLVAQRMVGLSKSHNHRHRLVRLMMAILASSRRTVLSHRLVGLRPLQPKAKDKAEVAVAEVN